MAFTIDNLEIQIETNATKATHGLDSLAASLAKLKMSIGDTSGLASNLKDIATALETFSSVGKIRMTVPINQLKKLGTIVPILGNSQATQMADNLKKIAESIATFSAMSGVGKEMKDAAKGMDALAKSSQKFESATNKANKAHKGTIYLLSKFVNQYRRLYQVIDEVVDVCADLFIESNEYIEALNLFKVSMGEASDAALKYAETVSAAMGIDPAEWISNQGTFQRMTTGFGIVSEEAEIMSQNLTQLAYDLSSFFNTDITTAMQKLQSGMSGQIKGLKAWGYNLSVAALQETALSLGIEESVRNMTEAQKAQLRYITLIQKSNGIMGDMAKTINTPANAMRILNAQITLLKRSLGNIVSVIATRVIPYIQAFVEVMAEGARALAETWGFEIKDLPTNNLEMASEIIDGIGEDVDNTTNAVAELKKQLAGFDELNILKSNDDDTANKAQASLNIDLPSYDFLSNLDNETRERIEEIKEQIKGLTSLLGDLAKVFAVAFAVSTLVAAKNAIKLFFTETALGIGIMDAFVDAMQSANLVFEAGDGVFRSLKTGAKSLGQSFKTAMSSLSPFTKALVSIVALGLEFVVVKNAVYDLTKGNKSLGESLLAIIPICGAVGVAMYTMLGPWGLVAAAVTAVIAAVVGFVKAEKEMRAQLANDAFYDGYGKTIADLAAEFDGLMVSATEAYEPILEIQGEIISSKEKIKKTSEEVATLVFQVESGATRIEDAIPTIVDAFKTLYNDTRSYLTDTSSLIYSALAGNVGKALTDLGIDIQAVSQATGKITNEALAAIDALNTKNSELEEKHKAGLITDDEFYNQVAENIAAIQKWSGVTDDTNKAINDAKSGLMDIFSEGINWESDNLVGDLEGFKTAAEDAKTTITDAYGELIAAFEEQKRLAQLEGKDASIFDEAINGAKIAMEGEVKGIDDMLSGAFYALQEDIANSMAEVYDTALKGYDNLNFFKKMWYGFDAGNYANAVLNDFKKNTLSPIVEELKKAVGDDAVFVDEIISQITGVIGTTTKHDGSRETTYHQSADGLGIKKALEESGKDTVAGLISGLTSEQKSVYDESRKMGLSVLEAYDAALDINSPSREMEKRGGYTVEGLANGLTNNMSLLDSALDNLLGRFDFLSTIQGFWKKVTDWWRNISLPEVDLKMPHFSWTTQPAEGWVADILKTIGLEPKLPKLNVEWYASGGFPTMGQMFIARESGPELVGRIGNKNAVINNDQIITGIASAVYSAMMAAQEDGGNGEGGSTRIVVQIGDQAVGEASVRYINGRIVQTGESPIYS